MCAEVALDLVDIDSIVRLRDCAQNYDGTQAWVGHAHNGSSAETPPLLESLLYLNRRDIDSGRLDETIGATGKDQVALLRQVTRSR